MMRLPVLFFLLCSLPIRMLAQDSEQDSRKQSVIEQRIEFLAEVLEAEDLDYSTIFEDLSWYYDHPINLNAADAEALKRLFLLNDFQINSIIDYRRKYREMISIYELSLVRGMDPETVRMVMPFVMVAPSGERDKLDIKRVLKYGRHDLFLRYQRILEEQEGFSDIDDSVLAANPNKRYLGNPDRYFMRYRFRFADRISAGFTAEKDPGEEFFRGSQKSGFDFYSAHFFYRGKGLIRQIALGDFQVEFGQGLTAWSGLAFGKSPALVSSIRSGQHLRPNTSAEENLFMRGAGITLQKGKWKGTLFGSYKAIDANVVEDTTIQDDGVVISSFQTSGLHRTPSEIEDRNSLGELHAGGHIAYMMEQAEIGVTGVFTSYSRNVNRNLSAYNQFDFNANNLLNIGADYKWIFDRYQFFGEIGYSGNNGSVANIHGVNIQADTRLKLLAIFRDYPRDYQAQLGNALAEGSRPSNETAFLLGAEAAINRYLSMSGYVDYFWSNWLRFRVDGPSEGMDVLAQLNYSPGRNTQTYLRFRYKAKEINASAVTEGLNTLVPQEKMNIRLHGAFNIGPSIKLRSRAEYVNFNQANGKAEHGFLFYQDVSWKFNKLPITVTGRITIFETDSYDARVYAYESDVLYAFSIPAYFDRGTRTYLLLKYEPFERVDIWLRWSQWYYDNEDEISSGLNLIEGRTKSEIKAQVRIRF